MIALNEPVEMPGGIRQRVAEEHHGHARAIGGSLRHG